MNKILYTFIISLASFLFTSCGSNEKELAQQYIDACAENDFGKANAILDKMDIDSEHGTKYLMKSHKEYVNKKEILYLIAQGDEQSANRLMFLIKEHDGGMSAEKIVNLAITQENEYLASKMVDTGQGVSNANVEAAVSAKMDGLVLKFIRRNTDLLSNSSVLNYLKVNNIELLHQAQELKLDNMVTNIASFEFRGVPMANGCRDYDSNDEYEHNHYRESVEKYNRLLDNALNQAINYENKKYAQKLLNMYKSMPSNAENGGIYRERGANLDVPITYSNAPYIDAQKRYNEALKAGLLK